MSAPNQITVQVRNVYGNDRIYPVCDKAKLFAQIAGTTTLAPSTLRKIERLGYTITSMGMDWRDVV